MPRFGPIKRRDLIYYLRRAVSRALKTAGSAIRRCVVAL